MLLKSLLATLSALVSLSEALPNHGRTNDLAPRAVPSAGGATCYFSCPETGPNGAAFYGLDRGAEEYYGEGSVYCNYYVVGFCIYRADGSFYGGATAGCPERATPAGCTYDGNPPNAATDFRKRSLPRGKTDAEQRLAARQYKPKHALRA